MGPGNWSRLEVRAVIRFLWARNVSASERRHVVKLCHSFQSGRQEIESPNMTGSSRLGSSSTENSTERIGCMIQNDRRVKRLREASSELGLSYGTLQHIVFDVLRYPKTVP
ncbi:uncharacterized protein TNCV_3793431 [Trichonephila clavipes]|nr:uncharacterized protein TNCV_3793431 [Trichonephila clavipes]